MTFIGKPAVAALAAVIAATAFAHSAEAGKRRAPEVTACSDYGNGCYRAPVRRAKWGHKMRLKHGTWIDCRGDCQQTLREETIDFWETQNDKALTIGP